MTFSSKLDWGSYIISIAKIRDWIHSMKFFSPEFALYLYKSTMRPCMEYHCHIWVGARSCYLELLNKLQKQIRRTVGPWLAASLEPLPHHRNVASLSLFYRYYLLLVIAKKMLISGMSHGALCLSQKFIYFIAPKIT